MRFFFLLVALCLLSACASSPRQMGELPAREALREFALEARFSLKIERVGEVVQQVSGRLSWQHQNESDHVFLANPFGSGVADIEMRPRHSSLHMANGEVRQHEDADLLMQDVTGYALPVSRLAPWLLGRAGVDGHLVLDSFGRPGRLQEAGWLIEYLYADEHPGALPLRLEISRASEVKLTLRIDEWQALP
jgi:outer membrane lipoprotein LolB